MGRAECALAIRDPIAPSRALRCSACSDRYSPVRTRLYYLLLTTDYVLRTTYYLLLTTHYLLLTTHYVLSTTYYLLLTTYYVELATY